MARISDYAMISRDEIHREKRFWSPEQIGPSPTIDRLSYIVEMLHIR